MTDAEQSSWSDGEVVWRVSAGRTACWRTWDDEVVVYDDLSGDTSQLDPAVAALFFRLLERPATEEELVLHLRTSFAFDDERRLGSWTSRALHHLRRAGLIEMVGESEGAGLRR